MVVCIILYVDKNHIVIVWSWLGCGRVSVDYQGRGETRMRILRAAIASQEGEITPLTNAHVGTTILRNLIGEFIECDKQNNSIPYLYCTNLTYAVRISCN